MSNLLKSFSLVCADDKRIIDSNEAVTVKLQEIRNYMTEEKGEFTLGLNPTEVNDLLDDGEIPRIIGEDSEISEELQKKSEDIIAEANERATQMLIQAEKDASRIVEDAKRDASEIMVQAREEGYVQGELEGKQSVQEEIKRLQNEYAGKQNALEQDYLERRKKLEPELVDVMMDVFKNVTKVLAEDQKDMIVALIDKVLSGTEANNNYIIKACREDAAFLRENKENILKRINREINLEIVEDISMHRNECLIDTDLGIYDCSLDIQLDNLIRSIKVLSCAVEYK